MPHIKHRNQIADQHFESTHGRKSFWSAIVSIWLGTTMEYVDFALYGMAAGLVFSDVFFPEQTKIIALLSAFITYAVGFLARPVGAFVLGRLGDRVGRKKILVFTVALMGIATSGIGLLPTYASIGIWAPILLALLRICQGFGAGAELSGGAVMLAEYAPTRHRGLVASLIGVGSNSGTLLASIVWLLVLLLPHEQVISWGWRIPFLCSVLVAAFALFLRRSMDESPVFKTYQEKKARELADLDKAENEPAKSTFGWKAFLVMLGLRIGENGRPTWLRDSWSATPSTRWA